MAYTRLTRERIAELVAADIPDGLYVNLGIGIPTLIPRYLPAGREVVLHSENGILGMGPGLPGPLDTDLINAGKQPISLLPGAAICDQVLSFAMMRGGHLDLTVLGAFQVSQQGDLANWDTGAPHAIPAVGGAMDLAVGAREVWVIMGHTTKEGAPRLVERCSYPLTGTQVVDRIYTDLAIVQVGPAGFTVQAMVAGITADELQDLSGAPLRFVGQPRVLG
ncbi:MAG: 3-oxoacid CoA-transferase subunit B [Burkholderiales bacterium]|nr:3-oxoacid CoA-transferase subunit B [Burkholderiales bacterium]